MEDIKEIREKISMLEDKLKCTTARLKRILALDKLQEKQKAKDEKQNEKASAKQKLKEEKDLKKAAKKVVKVSTDENLVIFSENGCKQILKTGSRKGQICGCKIKNGDFCSRHAKKEEVPLVD
jgi:hypothetical protein